MRSEWIRKRMLPEFMNCHLEEPLIRSQGGVHLLSLHVWCCLFKPQNNIVIDLDDPTSGSIFSTSAEALHNSAGQKQEKSNYTFKQYDARLDGMVIRQTHHHY